MMMLILV